MLLYNDGHDNASIPNKMKPSFFRLFSGSGLWTLDSGLLRCLRLLFPSALVVLLLVTIGG